MTVSTLSIALAQINPIVGDLNHNAHLILHTYEQAWKDGADLILYPEMALTGYPIDDLVLRPSFLEAVQQRLETLAATTKGRKTAMLIGAPHRHQNNIYNAVFLLTEGRVADFRAKVQLPSYGVFDEKRVFQSGPSPQPLLFKGVSLGLPICEDIWTPDVCQILADQGAEIFLSPNASPFEVMKSEQRFRLAEGHVQRTKAPFIYLNRVGGQDELVFDGASFIMNPDGTVPVQLPAFREHYILTQWALSSKGAWICTTDSHVQNDTGTASIYSALCLGLKDYVHKNKAKDVILGLSGGIDSALVAVLAVDVLGADHVRCVMMPSPYTSSNSLEDAAAVAKNLGCRLDTIPITPAMSTLQEMLAPSFQGLSPNITEENIQSRLRGLILMAISNKWGGLVLTTGNKSEMGTGYATLYGDMCGAYAVLKDVYKTLVFDLTKWRNEAMPPDAKGPAGRVIPDRIIQRPPSAELRPNQTDQDSLPPYEVLDDILASLVDHEMSVTDTVRRGHDIEIVQRVWDLLNRAEYKRFQSPPGPKITRKAFGRDRRYPLTHGFKEVSQQTT